MDNTENTKINEYISKKIIIEKNTLPNDKILNIAKIIFLSFDLSMILFLFLLILIKYFEIKILFLSILFFNIIYILFYINMYKYKNQKLKTFYYVVMNKAGIRILLKTYLWKDLNISHLDDQILELSYTNKNKFIININSLTKDEYTKINEWIKTNE